MDERTHVPTRVALRRLRTICTASLRVPASAMATKVNTVEFHHRSAYPDFIFDIARLIRTNAECYLCLANGTGSDGRSDRPPDGSDRQC
jgi:hypothetical protein